MRRAGGRAHRIRRVRQCARRGAAEHTAGSRVYGRGRQYILWPIDGGVRRVDRGARRGARGLRKRGAQVRGARYDCSGDKRRQRELRHPAGRIRISCAVRIYTPGGGRVPGHGDCARGTYAVRDV